MNQKKGYGMDSLRDRIIDCFLKGYGIHQTEKRLSVASGTIPNKYPEIYQMFKTRAFVEQLKRDAMIVEEWVNNEFCPYRQVQRVIKRKTGRNINNAQIKEATTRYMKPVGETELITLKSKI